MKARRRTVPIAFTAVIALTALGLALMGHGDPQVDRAASDREPAVLGPSQEPADRSREARTRPPARSDPVAEDRATPPRTATSRHSKRVGRRFVAGLLRWERGGGRGRRLLRRTGTRRLATTILEEPPRPPLGGDRPPPARLVGLIVSSAFHRVLTLEATIKRAGRRSGLLLTLLRRGRRWRVDRMR